MQTLKYLAHYPESLQAQVKQLIAEDKLGAMLSAKYRDPHAVRNDRQLYEYTLEIKDRYLRKTERLDKVIYDSKLHVVKHALGTHTSISRVQGNKLKASREIRIATVFRDAPSELLRMIVVHELAHLKESDHNKSFYQLCRHMEPDYHQLEFDVRLYLTHLEMTRETDV